MVPTYVFTVACHANVNLNPMSSAVTEENKDCCCLTGLDLFFCHFPLGCVEFLEQPAMAFVRLNEAVLLESVLEVPVPVRFLFVLLGPSQSNVDYHEIGRSFSTLMSDKVDFQRRKSRISWINIDSQT